MRRALTVLLGVLVLLAAAPKGQSARDPAATASGPVSIELVVFVTSVDPYSARFRSVIVPAYERSGRAERLPLRILDVARLETPAPTLAEPIASVPTAVLIKDGSEVGRIAGYADPRDFFLMLDRLLAETE